MKRIKLRIAVIASVLLYVQTAYGQNKDAQGATTITSPNGEIVMSVTTSGGVVKYTVNYRKMPVVEASRLGLVINGKLSGETASTGKVQRYKENKTYSYRGVHSKAVNNYNGAKIAIASGQSPFTIDARVFNDGVAFRYIVDNAGAAIVEKDTTAFVLPAGSIVWSQNNIRYYEGRYTGKNIEAVKKDELAGPPVTIGLPGNAGYAAITEGGLTDFGGMSLRANGNNGFTANLTGITKKNSIIETSWRIIVIGKDLNTLVNCDIVANVSSAYNPVLFPQGYNTSWLKPGRSVWSWLAVNRSVTLPNMKKFSDLAAQLGFEYNLVDEGWGNWKDTLRKIDHWAMMKELVDYSATKGVKVWVWKAYPDRGGIPGIKDPEKRKEFFKKCNELGIVGLKVDFFDSESQEIINFYQAALKDAAEYHLMMNFHGANKPTGEARTWPNEMTREAVRGFENQPPWAPGSTIFPFTRYLAGHADFTPVHFGNRMGEVSWAHHVASLVVYTSPFLCVGADPQSILDNPSKEMIQSVPPIWDETIVLPPSKIGDLTLYARRNGTTWFVAAMNGVHEPKTVNVNLSFLKKGNYKLSLMKDDKDKQANAIFENAAVTSKSPLTITLNGEGGFVGRFEKK